MSTQTQPSLPSLLTIKQASKSYNGIPALVDASLDLRAGEVHALVGENGAGKSTLIKLLAGVLRADSIQVSMQGQPASIHHAQDAFDHGLRFIHQELNVVPHLSVAENIFLSHAYPRRLGIFVDWRRLNEQAQSVLSALGISHLNVRQQMARLSPGDQMLICIARAFAGDEIFVDGARQHKPLIYVMDEPTASLSGQETKMLFKVVNQLREQGSAVLYVSHRLEEIFKICDRVTVMRDGRVIEVCDIKQITPADLIRLMTGRNVEQIYPAGEGRQSEKIVLSVQSLQTSAVRDINFELASGQIMGVAGLNGSGRTELLRALMGLDHVIRGEIHLNGNHLKSISASQAWYHGIAFVPEERRTQGLVLSRSINDNITLPQLRHISRQGWLLDYRLERNTSLVLGEKVRLKSNNPEQTVRQLSGGNQQKVLFARALAHPLSLLLLDEPTRGVDVGAKADIYHLIRQISAQGTAILIVSSDLPELIGLADRILIMQNRRLVNNISANGMTTEDLLALCYGEIIYERS